MKLLLDLFNHLLLCRCRWHLRIIFVVAQIHMSMRTDTFVLMRKMFSNCTQVLRLCQNRLVSICQKLTKKISELSPDHRQFVRDTLYDLQNLSKDRTENRQVASIVDSDKLNQIKNDKRLPRCAEILYRAYVQTPRIIPMWSRWMHAFAELWNGKNCLPADPF